jgi:tRNA dimethylallyltransferase
VTAHLALVGTTASGKSALALEVARRYGGIELVSVDAMQVYRGMDIGTATPSLAEQAEVPHHLIDMVEPEDEFSVAEFQRAARDAIAGIESRGHRALLVGGTGLYVRALVDDLELPGAWPEVRAELGATPPEQLWDRLRALDPAAAARIAPGNTRRLVRALEVTIGSGRPFSSFGPGLDAYPPTRFRQVGVWLPRAVVRRRVEQRFGAMLDAGWLAEVDRLRTRALSRTARQALGYKELLAHLAGDLTLDEAVATGAQRTIAFARRQRVWFRRDPRITWLGAPDNPVAVLPALLGEWSE